MFANSTAVCPLLATSLLWNLNTSLTISSTTHCLSRLLPLLHECLKLKTNTLNKSRSFFLFYSNRPSDTPRESWGTCTSQLNRFTTAGLKKMVSSWFQTDLCFLLGNSLASEFYVFVPCLVTEAKPDLYTFCLYDNRKSFEKFVNFRLLWPCVMNIGWRERNQQDATNQMFIIKLLSQHVSGIIMPVFKRTRLSITA